MSSTPTTIELMVDSAKWLKREQSYVKPLGRQRPLLVTVMTMEQINFLGHSTRHRAVDRTT